MLRTLLTPLSARFALSPSSPQPGLNSARRDELSPEEFARDVLIELMKTSVERLKASESLQDRTQVLTEIHKIMLEDARTKDVFREMDGFLVVMSVLSTIQANASDSDETRVEVLEATRLAFVILSEALYLHRENTEYFKDMNLSRKPCFLWFQTVALLSMLWASSYLLRSTDSPCLESLTLDRT